MQAKERDLMREWTIILRDHVPSRPDACRWLLDELARSPANLKELLLSADDTVRDAAADVLHVTLRTAVVAAGGGDREGNGGDLVGEGVAEDVYLAAFAEIAAMEGGRGHEGTGEGDLVKPFFAVGQESTPEQDESDQEERPSVRFCQGGVKGGGGQQVGRGRVAYYSC